MATHTKWRRVLLMAVASRVLILLAMVVSDSTLADLDSSAWLQQRPCDDQCITKECMTMEGVGDLEVPCYCVEGKAVASVESCLLGSYFDTPVGSPATE